MDSRGKGKKGAAGTNDGSDGGGVSKKKSVPRSVRAGLQFPVSRIGRYLKQGLYSERIGTGAPIYLAAVLEYLVAEVLEVAGNAAMDNKRNRITPRHIVLAVRNDEELAKLFSEVTIPFGGVVPNINPVLLPRRSEKRAAAAEEQPPSPSKKA
ncbi:histone H2A-beta, sperm-like [Cucurbita maxima]|uniref:Histone H2A n=1 Tax=Cucurbita maxima TaxID=3661 RepID=A0A6J1I9I0_CUCMA|nr:histone H2A-beta, sperm-like [Cucurbita maxima]